MWNNNVKSNRGAYACVSVVHALRRSVLGISTVRQSGADEIGLNIGGNRRSTTREKQTDFISYRLSKCIQERETAAGYLQRWVICVVTQISFIRRDVSYPRDLVLQVTIQRKRINNNYSYFIDVFYVFHLLSFTSGVRLGA